MKVAELILCFCIGLALILFIGWIFSLRTKGLFRLVLNTAAGAVALLVLSTFTPLPLPLNPFNALITGLLGVPGVGVLLLAACFL